MKRDAERLEAHVLRGVAALLIVAPPFLGGGNSSTGLLVLHTAAFLLAAPSVALADEYESTRAGHPLRIAGYVLHPFGVVIDTLILRPAHWVGSHEPWASIFGHTEERDY